MSPDLSAEATVQGTVLLTFGADTIEVDTLTAQHFLDEIELAIMEAEE